MANLNFNHFVFAGKLTKDPELTGDGQKLHTKFTVAVNRKYKVEGQDKADFFDCVSFGKTAETVNNYFHKGSTIQCVGSVEIQRWKGEDDKYRQRVECKVYDVFFVDSKNESPSASVATSTPPEDNFTELADESDLPF